MRRDAVRALTDELGPLAESVALRIERSRSFDELRPLSLIRRLIDADEIGAMVAFLASPLAAATNGAAIRAEGGIVPTIA